MELNTVYQLYALKKYRPHILERADRLLFMPDLFGYMLTGNMTTEYSIATTSQMVDIATKTWATGLLDRLGIPSRLLCDIKPSGSVLGSCARISATSAECPPPRSSASAATILRAR